MNSSNLNLKKLAVVVFSLALCVGVAPALRAQTEPSKSAGNRATAGETSTPGAEVPEKKEEAQDENDAYLHSPTVVKLGSMMGMKPEMAATSFTIFNFVVLALAVGFFLVKSLPKTFRDRNSRIQKNLVDARTATEEASARLSSVEERLARLDVQIAAMRTQSEQDSARDEQRIKASLEDEKRKIVAAAEQEIASATTTARRDLQQYAAELAISHAAKKLIVTAETDRLLVESFAHKLSSGFDPNGGGQN